MTFVVRRVSFLLKGLILRALGRPLAVREIPYPDYIDLQLQKSLDPERRRKWRTEEWEEKLGAFEKVFSGIFTQQGVQPSTALCIGARTGQEVVALNSLGVSAVGIDLGAEPPHVLEMDMHSLTFEDSTFDFVYTNCFDHSLYPKKAVAEIERVLGPSGVCVLHLQMNKPNDKFGVTDIFSEQGAVDLFHHSELVWSRRLEPEVLAMTYELGFRKSG